MQTAQAGRYEFGKNWANYSRVIDEDRIGEAERGLREILDRDSLEGQCLLDIGCGSGLHALAALRMGASKVKAIDLSHDSVATTQRLLEQHWAEGNYRVEVADLLALQTDETFDVVYSWGVLHHTGEMWRAIERAASLVRPGGLFAIAIYRKTRFCPFWTWEKRMFVSRGPIFKTIATGLYVALRFLRDILNFRRPFARYRRGKASNRGMHWYYNVQDWLGGYPYESADPAEVVAFVEGQGFETVKTMKVPKRKQWGVFGSGNAQFLFRRKA